ncbi:MAG: T9SS type A sorting domain-containing protein, partial [bacterium]
NPAQVFIGEKGVSGADNAHLNNPQSLDVDARGNIFVCDRGNDRIAVYNSQGVFQNALSITDPIGVAVHPVSGKIYAYCANELAAGENTYGKLLQHKIIRLAGKNDATQEISISFDSVICQAQPVFALDKHADPPVIWLGSFVDGGGYLGPNGDITKIIDNGSTFEDIGNVIAQKSPDVRLGRVHHFLTVDPENEEVWWDDMIFDGNSGNFIRTFIHSDRVPWQQAVRNKEPVFGPDNSVLFRWPDDQSFSAAVHLERYHREDGTPFPFSGTGSHIIDHSTLHGGGGMMPRGFAVDKSGDIYVIHHREWRDRQFTQVSVVGWDGIIKRDTIIKIDSWCGGIDLDNKGNIYMGAHLKPFGKKMPAFFEDFFANTYTDAGSYGMYKDQTGSILKFGNAGGTVLPSASGTSFESTTGEKFNAQGVVWSRFTCTEQQTKALNCVCQVNRHDVDGYNRIYVPDPLTYSIWVYDENGNEITRFGDYGNMDSRGTGSAIGEPDIPFSYPRGVAVSNKAAYVNDVSGHRIVKANLTYKETGYADIGTVLAEQSKPGIISNHLYFSNPLNAGGVIEYRAGNLDMAKLMIYNLQGKMVREFTLARSGNKTASFLFDGKDFRGRKITPGLYILRLVNAAADKTLKSVKMVVM